MKKFNQSLSHQIVKKTGWKMKVLVPPYWKSSGSNRNNYLEKDFDELYEIVIGKIRFPGNLRLAVFRSYLKFILKEYQPDIIDIENEPCNLGSFQIVWERSRYSANSKIVLRTRQPRQKNYQPLFNLTENYVLKKADALLACSETDVNYIREKGYSGILETIPPGVNTNAFHPRNLPELRRQLNPTDKLLLGFIGDLEKHNGVHHLIHALAGLDCSLLVVGEGRLKTQLVKLAESNKVNAGFVSGATHEEIAQYMNCIDLLVQPTQTRHKHVEKIGRVLMEAMASGVPVIVSDSGEIPNILGDAALVFREGDIKDLRIKLRMLLDNAKMRNEMGWRGRRLMEKKYSWKIVANKTIKVYQNLLTSN